MLNIAFDLKNQIISDLESSSNLEKISYENLLIMGMGGSGVAGDVMKVLSNEISDKNIIVHKEYSIPKQFLKFRPLCLFISYSGNTEETLSGISDAKKNNLDWIVISSGGELIDLAQEEGKEYIKIPSGLQPRAAFGYLTLAISRILDIVEGSDYVSQLNESSSYLYKLTEKAEDSDINKLSLDICESITKKLQLYIQEPICQRLYRHVGKLRLMRTQNPKLLLVIYQRYITMKFSHGMQT